MHDFSYHSNLVDDYREAVGSQHPDLPIWPRRFLTICDWGTASPRCWIGPTRLARSPGWTPTAMRTGRLTPSSSPKRRRCTAGCPTGWTVRICLNGGD